MKAKKREAEKQQSRKRSVTPTFLLELPLQVTSAQARHVRGHFEAARNLYNALFSALRKEFGFAKYALHLFATRANTTWIADHLHSQMAQTLATRAYRAANRVCCGKARKVRFRSKGRGLDNLEGKTNTQGIRFVLQPPKDGNEGWLVWGKERLVALIDWHDPVIRHGLKHRKSLHGKLVHEVVACGNTIITEKISYRERVCPKVLRTCSKSQASAMALEELTRHQEPPCISAGESQYSLAFLAEVRYIKQA